MFLLVQLCFRLPLGPFAQTLAVYNLRYPFDYQVFENSISRIHSLSHYQHEPLVRPKEKIKLTNCYINFEYGSYSGPKQCSLASVLMEEFVDIR